MRPINARDLPKILRQLRAPPEVWGRFGLGSLYSDQQQIGVPDYNETTIWAGRAAELQQVSGLTPVAVVDSVRNVDSIQSCPADAPLFSDIDWTCQNFNNAGVITLTGNSKRCILLIENLTAAPVAVSFGTTARYSAAAAQLQGIVLTGLGSSLLADRYCPTNSIYIDCNGSAVAVVQGTRTQALPPPWVVTGDPGGP